MINTKYLNASISITLALVKLFNKLRKYKNADLSLSFVFLFFDNRTVYI